MKTDLLSQFLGAAEVDLLMSMKRNLCLLRCVRDVASAEVDRDYSINRPSSRSDDDV